MKVRYSNDKDTYKEAEIIEWIDDANNVGYSSTKSVFLGKTIDDVVNFYKRTWKYVTVIGDVPARKVEI